MTNLRDAIREMHGCYAYHIATIPVHLTFEGQTAWEGEVELFDLVDHPTASQCFAWSYEDDNGKTHFTAVLRLPPVKTAQDAVKAAIVAQVKNERKET